MQRGEGEGSVANAPKQIVRTGTSERLVEPPSKRLIAKITPTLGFFGRLIRL